MKMTMKRIVSISILFLFLCVGCSTHMFKTGVGGAASGAVGASFVGAMTDLILDGKVNTDRLARNATSGAIAGSMAGAAVGHNQDIKEEQAARKVEAEARRKAQADFKAKIGSDNYSALTDLLNCRHSTAYRKAAKAADSRNKDVQEAAYVIQALVDTERGNREQAQEALKQFVAINDNTSKSDAQKGLKALLKALGDERKAQGISCE